MVAPPAPAAITTFSVSSLEELATLRRMHQLNDCAVRTRQSLRLQCAYLDTTQLTLLRNGVTVRFGRHDTRWEATATRSSRSRRLTAITGLTVPLAAAPRFPIPLPEGPLRVHLAALAAGRSLSPILIGSIERRCCEVLPAGSAPSAGGACASLTVDRLRLAPPDHKRGPFITIGEITVAAASTAAETAGLLEALRTRFGVPATDHSQVVRALELFHGTHLPDGSEPALPDAAATVGDALRTIVNRQLWRLRQHDPGTRIGDDPEPLHDMRVAVRRIRAAIRVFGAALAPRFQDELKSELSFLGQSLGPVRDLDVQLGKLGERRSMGASGKSTALTALAQYLRAERDGQRVHLLAALDSARYFRLLIRLEAYALSGRGRARGAAARQMLASAAQRVLKKAMRKLLTCGRGIEKSAAPPAAEDLHALRIRAKRLRYQFEFLSALTGKPGRRFVRRLTRLQDVLGTHHDAMVAAAHLRAYAQGPGAHAEPTELVALGELIGNEMRLADEARSGFHARWQRFARKRTLRDFDDVLRRLRKQEEPRATDAVSAK